MRYSSLMIKKKDMECKCAPMVLSTMGTGNKGANMVMEFTLGLMGENMKDSS